MRDDKEHREDALQQVLDRNSQWDQLRPTPDWHGCHRCAYTIYMIEPVTGNDGPIEHQIRSLLRLHYASAAKVKDQAARIEQLEAILRAIEKSLEAF